MQRHKEPLMTNDYKLSLPSAILININIMLGAGIFLNTVEVAKRAGVLGALSYTCVGILLLPLIASIATLMRMYPSGGFYTFAQKGIGTTAGFINAWVYFTGKLASSTIIIHASVTTIQQLVPALAIVHTFVLDACILTLFISLNMLDIKAGSSIQKMFIVFKSLPILFAILAGLYLFNPGNLTETHHLWQGFSSTFPLVLFATMGFEATCSLSDKIKNPSVNGPIAIYTSYGIALFLITLYQLAFYGALGADLLTFATYRDAFPALCAYLMPNSPYAAQTLGGFFNIAIAVSALGGAYGILFSNTWNLYTLAHNKHIIGARFFSRLNRYKIPVLCVVAEGVISIVYLLVSQGNQVALQQIAALSATITYTISVCALLMVTKKQSLLSRMLPICGLISCLLLIGRCLSGLMVVGLSVLGVFASLFVIGMGMYYVAPHTDNH